MPFDFSKNLITIVQIFVSLFILSQALIVLVQNPRSNMNRSFSLFQFSVFVWMMGMGLAYLIVDESLALTIAKIGYIGVSTIPVTTYVFSSYFRGIKPNKLLTSLGIILTAIVAFNINNPTFVVGTINYEWGNYMLLGPGGFVSVFMFAIFLSLFGWNLYKVYKVAERRKKWYLLAFIFGLLSFVGAIDFLPGYKILTSIHPLGFIFVSVFSSFMGYFIIRYSLSDVKLVLGKAVGHAVMVGLLILIYISVFITLSPGVHDIKDVIANLFFFISAVYLFNLFNRVGKKLTDEIFYKNRISFEKRINDFEKELYRFQDPNKFFKEIFDFIEDSLRIENPLFIIIDDRDKSWLLVKPDGMKIVSEKKPMTYKGFTSPIEKDNPNIIIDVRQVSHVNEITKEAIILAEENQGVLISSLFSRSGIAGYLVFGKQLTSSSYDADTKKSLKDLTNAISISWENVKLFENIERENQLKMDFVSIASHQLRTPLTRLKWSLELILSKTKLEKDTQKIFSDLTQSTDNMIELVGQLLNVAESEKTDATKNVVFPIYPIVEEIVIKKHADIISKDISLVYDTIDKNINVTFSKNSLQVVLETIVDNAIQYTPHLGKINISAHMHDNIVEIQVSDNGIGIPKNEQGDIFTKFFRGNNAISIRRDGTGLGLYYAKLLTEKQGGNIWFHPRDGGGTVFHISLPVAQ